MEKQFQSVMDKPMLTNRGFTLIETLFVLMIMCILLTLGMAIHKPQKSETVCIQEITNFFYEAKLHAMISKEKVKLSVGHDKISYKSLSSYEEYDLKEGCYFDKYTMTFNSSGNVKTAKTLIYSHEGHIYRFVYQVGSGCFYVQS